MSRSGSANIRQGKQANGQERRKDTSREKGFQPPRLRGSKTPRRFMESWLFVDVIIRLTNGGSWTIGVGCGYTVIRGSATDIYGVQAL
jgi:hypothetical protein